MERNEYRKSDPTRNAKAKRETNSRKLARFLKERA